MTTSATAAIANDKSGTVSLEEVILDDIAPREVLVRIEACGICHTDEKFRQRLPLPAVFGHEGVGVVEAVGSTVGDVDVGERVILSYPFCTECAYCERSEPYRCERIPALKFGGKRLDGSATISLDGTDITSAFFQQSSFATHAIALEQAIVPVSDLAADCPAEVLAALPCGVQTGAGAVMNTFDGQVGESIAIMGAGAVGLSAVMAAKVIGMSPIICVDLHAGRLELAGELGATHVINVSDGDVVESIRSAAPEGARYALDSSATVPGLETAIAAIGQGGKVGIVSYPNEGEPFPFNTKELFLKVASLHGIVQGFSVPRAFLPRLLELYNRGVFPIDKLVTTYEFKDINTALDDAHSGAAIKPVLLM